MGELTRRPKKWPCYLEQNGIIRVKVILSTLNLIGTFIRK